MSRTTITLRTSGGDERTYSLLGAVPATVEVEVSQPDNDTGLFDPTYEFNQRFSGKTYARVGSTLRFDEVV